MKATDDYCEHGIDWGKHCEKCDTQIEAATYQRGYADGLKKAVEITKKEVGKHYPCDGCLEDVAEVIVKNIEAALKEGQ